MKKQSLELKTDAGSHGNKRKGGVGRGWNTAVMEKRRKRPRRSEGNLKLLNQSRGENCRQMGELKTEEGEA